MKVYLFPRYVNLNSGARALNNFLEKQGIDVQDVNWDGEIDSLPTDEPAFIRASSQLNYEWDVLARFCQEHGHFCFYDDHVVNINGELGDDPIKEAAAKFLEQNKPKEMDPALVITYLKSRPKDDSTLGTGDHVRRQAKMMLRLWDRHVLKGYKPAGSGEFDEPYQVIQMGSALDPGEHLGMDFDGVTALRAQVEKDRERLIELGIKPDGVEDAAQRYCFKLRNGLAANLQLLVLSTVTTSSMYSLGEMFGEGVGGLALIMNTFSARRNTDMTGIGVTILYKVMLPILTEKLIEAGYPNSDEVIEWDYGEASKAHGLKLLSQAGQAIGISVSQGIETTTKASCKNCGHSFEVKISQELETDGKTPKGDPKILGLPDTCPNCGQKFESENDSVSES